jgi:orotidine-5'-phosphate decarboxylase
MARKFFEMLEARWKKGLFLCVGLDPDYERIPESARLSSPADNVRRFNRQIVEATSDMVCCYKPNMAFYERLGHTGWFALRETIADIRAIAPAVPVILDYKRADIGNTNAGYVAEAFELFGADAVTVHPYLGQEAVQPFLDQKDKGIFVLCRTSNPGADEFQNLIVEVTGEAFDKISQAQPATSDGFSIWSRIPLYQYVAYRVMLWNRAHKNCGVVVGATAPQELREVRRIVGDMPILIPGVGAQGGDLFRAVQAGKDSRGRGMIINSSRDIIFASREADYADAARAKAKDMNEYILGVLEVD